MALEQKAKEYLKVRIETAKSTELLIMLFDGAIKFATQAKKCIEEKDFEKKNSLLLRSQEIILELIQALDREIGPQLYNNLVGLYRFCYERLLQGNIRNDIKSIDEALKILSHLRETWHLAVQKFERELPLEEEKPKHTICLKG